MHCSSGQQFAVIGPSGDDLHRPANHFIGATGRIIKTCCRCRGIDPPPVGRSAADRTPPPPEQYATQAALTASLGALQAQVDERLDAQQATLERIVALLASNDAGRIQPDSGAQPRLPPAAGEFDAAVTATARIFPWVARETVDLVGRDLLKPEQLIKLRNPESAISREPPAAGSLVLEGGFLNVREDTQATKTSAFLRAVPSLPALCQLWWTYVGIRAQFVAHSDPSMVSALCAYMENLIELDALYQYPALVNYHLAVCRKRFGVASAADWALLDTTASSTYLQPFRKTAPSPAAPASTSRATHAPSRPAAGPSKPAVNPSEPCEKFNLGKCSRPGCPRAHVCLSCRSADHGLVTCNAGGKTRPRTGGNPHLGLPAPNRHLGPPAPNRHLGPPAPNRYPGPPAPNRHLGIGAGRRRCLGPAAPNRVAASPAPNRPDKASPAPNPAALAPRPSIRLIPPPPRPNTTCALPVFDPADSPATLGSLRAERWEPLLALYPDPEYRAQVLGALRHGIKLGYADDGPLRTATRLDVGNLPMDDEDRVHVRREIAARLAEGRLRLVLNPEAERLVCSPLGVVPKPNSDKRRTIYHLSHPRLPAALPSVNAGIVDSFVRIEYESLDKLLDFVRDNPSASLWKADLEDAFRHVITCLADARLMGISFDGEHYKECALAFGGKSSPWLFNLLAEFLHWLAELLLQPKAHVASPVSHYLDDFFGATAAGTDPFRPVALLSLAAEALGFKISAKKTFWNRTRLEVLGVDVDSVAQTASVTPERRARLIALCERMLARGRASLLELQRVAGHLQFVTRVAPHGRAFLRRLHDAAKAHRAAPWGRRLSSAAKAELRWWVGTLHTWDGVSLLQPSPFVVEHVWTDASKRLIGGHCGLAERPSAVFSHELPRKHRSKDIRFLEALAVLEALRRFSPAWGGPRRVMLYATTRTSIPRRVQPAQLPPTSLPTRQLSRPPSGFASTVGLSPAAASLLWNGLAASTRSRASGTCAAFAAFAARAFRASEPFPATERMLADLLRGVLPRLRVLPPRR
ncbi:uncharacterized protein PFL1_06926 [Pseudozyma flocculosa PF-1]|uniref:C3H1-type domain-containing protein n=1 Tax=Pseudozyma flocculosa PF-1 TaxID=1277687 RepID=A0A061H0T0_9BASI|nr:uncharacterized protein PFL1_06926 [Pseudozyma flocculosa PF-1]EPQ25619.1 hypothetical protein PFL1_06926 [Pseudozyma flocculosa PF-1]